jgi:O-antigen/teichoic acid export membrane protein
MIYFRVDALMLHAYSSQEVTGWYGGAYRFFDAVMILPALLKVALFPVFSRLAIDSEQRLSDVFEKSLRMVLLVAIPISALIYIAAAPIIDFFMGVEEYAPSVVILQIFCIGIPMMFADFILGSVLIGSANRQSAWAGIGFTAILLNVSLNLWLIPLFQQMEGNGGAGAAISTILTELFILGSAVILLPKRYYMSFDSRVYLRLLGLTIWMIFLLWGFHHVGIHWFLQAILLSICFGIAFLGLRLLSKNERELFIDFLTQTAGFKRGGSSSAAIKQEVK